MTLKKREKATTINIGAKGGPSWPMKMGGGPGCQRPRGKWRSANEDMRKTRSASGPRARTRGADQLKERSEVGRSWSLFSSLSSPVSSASPPTRQHQQSTCSLSRLQRTPLCGSQESQSPSCGIPVLSLQTSTFPAHHLVYAIPVCSRRVAARAVSGPQ